MEESGQSRRADMQSLLYTLKDEIIIDYLRVFDRLPERTPRQKYTASLLAALDAIVYYGYPLNLLFYSNGGFEIITAETLLKEPGILNFRRKLRVMCVAMGGMEPEILDWFCGELTWEIPQAAIRILRTPGVVERLSGNTRFCLDCLEEIRHAGIAEAAPPDSIPKGPDELANLLAAQAAFNALCTHRDTEALKKDWREFLNCTAACLGCANMLERHTLEALTVRVFSGAAELPDFYLPITTICLMRFYMALIFSPTRIPFDAGLFRWVILGKQ